LQKCKTQKVQTHSRKLRFLLCWESLAAEMPPGKFQVTLNGRKNRDELRLTWKLFYLSLPVFLSLFLFLSGFSLPGKQLVETILKKSPKVLCLVVLSRDELKQFEMAQIFSQAKYPCMRYFLGGRPRRGPPEEGVPGHQRRDSRRRAQAGAGGEVQPFC